MICFRLSINPKTQTIIRVQRLPKPPDVIHESPWVKYIFRPSEEEARAFYNEYMRNKVQERRDNLRSQGKCTCGRDRDRPRPKPFGHLFYNKCKVCKERTDACHHRRVQRRAEALTGKHEEVYPHVRDDELRIENAQQRTRDRRAELRLETLIQVRDQWQNCRNVNVFTAWLEKEIQVCLTPKTKPQ